jgi:serine/threonine-protein kinase
VEPQSEPGGPEQARLRELRALFEQLAELAPEERDVRLARAAGAERARLEEALALLRESERDDSFLVPPAGARPSGAARLGHFTLERALAPVPGDEGPGSLHLARGADGEALALRVVPLVEDPLAAVARLRRTAPALAALHHCALVRCRESGLCAWPIGSEESALYFASEFVSDALPLTSVARDRALPEQALLEIFLAVCDALAAAHAAGLFHGALAGAGVRVDPQGRALVFDLGLRAVFPGASAPSAAGDRVELAELLTAVVACRAAQAEPWCARARELAAEAARAAPSPQLASVAGLAAALRHALAR